MAQNAIDELAVMVTANTAGLTAGLKQAERSLAQFRQDVAKAAGAGPPPVKAPPIPKSHLDNLRSMRSQFESVAAGAREAAAGWGAFVGRAAATAGVLIGAELGIKGVASAFSFLRESVDMAAEMEQTSLAFETMIGDAKEAQQQLAGIRQFAATTPFNNRELQQAARQLLAYGLAADQILPTLRMLGDVSAANPKELPMSRMAFLYGTLYSQKRAYTKDIQQFAGAGVPIIPELEKITGKQGAEFRDTLEEGRITIDEVTKAFQAMTSEGGRFYGMTARQGDTFAGQWEAAKDAIDMAKIKLGSIIIEEVGLKNAAKDFSGYMSGVQQGLERLRPTIRFIGDGIKGIVQYGHEFGRVMLAAGEAGANTFGHMFPGLAESAKQLKELVAGAQNFKLDEKQVIGGAAEVASIVGEGFVKFTKQIAEAGLMIYDIVQMIDKGIKGADQTVRAILGRLDEFNKHLPEKNKILLGGGLGNAILLKEAELYLQDRDKPPAAAVFQAPAPLPRFADQELKFLREKERQQLEHFKEPPDTARHMLIHPEDPAVAGRFPTLKNGQVVTPEEEKRFREQFRQTWTALGVAQENVKNGTLLPLPGITNGPQPNLPPQPQEPALIRGFRELLAVKSGDFRKTMMDERDKALQRLEDRKLQDAQEQAARAARQLADDQAAASQALKLFTNQLGGPIPTDPLGTLVNVVMAEAKGRQREFAGVAAMGGAFPAMQRNLTPQGGIRLVGGLPPHLQELARDLNKEFGDPMERLKKYKAELDELLAAGQIDKGIYNQAWGRQVQGEASKLGLDQPYQLPDAVQVGSVEDAKLLARFRSGGDAPKTTEDLLRQIVTILSQINTSNKAMQVADTAVRVFNIGP